MADEIPLRKTVIGSLVNLHILQDFFFNLQKYIESIPSYVILQTFPPTYFTRIIPFFNSL